MSSGRTELRVDVTGGAQDWLGCHSRDSVAVNDKLFRVYFDRKLHKAEDENNIYVIICLRSDVEAISIDINEDMPDIVNVFGVEGRLYYTVVMYYIQLTC